MNTLFSGKKLAKKKINRWLKKNNCYKKTYKRLTYDEFMAALDKYTAKPQFFNSITLSMGEAATIVSNHININADIIDTGFLHFNNSKEKYYFTVRSTTKEFYCIVNFKLNIYLEEFELKYSPLVEIQKKLTRKLTPLEVITERNNNGKHEK